MSYLLFGDGSCAGLQVVLRRGAPPDADRWTMSIVRRAGSTAPMPDVVRVSFMLPPGVRLRPERSPRSFFLEDASGVEEDELEVLPDDTFSEAGAIIEIFVRELSFGSGVDLALEGFVFEESPGASFRLSEVVESPTSRVVPLAVEAMQLLCTGGSPARDVRRTPAVKRAPGSLFARTTAR